MTSIQKNLVAGGVAFSVMLVTATLAYSIPIPALREVFADHLQAVVIWTVATSTGWVAARVVHERLP
jgi:uncharacterized membrane protein YdbT with pleckstrin-like domain